MVKSMDARARLALGLYFAILLQASILGKLLSLRLRFLICEMGTLNGSYLPGLLWGLTESAQLECVLNSTWQVGSIR